MMNLTTLDDTYPHQA